MLKTRIFFVLALAFASYLFYDIYYVNRGPNGIDINPDTYPVFGIDLSEYSGKVDFKRLKTEENIDFIYFRASAGNRYKDANVEKYYKQAKGQSIPIGFYHYYRFDEDPIAQARFFYQQVKGKKYRMPLVVDIEDWGNRSRGKSRTQIGIEIQRCLTHLDSLTKKKAILYTNSSGYKDYIKKHKKKSTPLWICSFSHGKKADNDWLFWQYSHKGKMDAVQGWVDKNTFHGSRKEWEAYLKKL